MGDSKAQSPSPQDSVEPKRTWIVPARQALNILGGVQIVNPHDYPVYVSTFNPQKADGSNNPSTETDQTDWLDRQY